MSNLVFLKVISVLLKAGKKDPVGLACCILLQGQIYILFRAPGRPSDWETRRQNGNSRQNLARMLPGLEL